MRLLWLHGITGDTPIRQIGWTYLLLTVLLVTLGCLLFELRRILGGE